MCINDVKYNPEANYTAEENTILKAMSSCPRDWRVAFEVRELDLDLAETAAVCRCLDGRGVATLVAVGEPFDFRGATLIGVGDFVPTRAGWRLVDSVD